jgi:hypothetical protein
MYSARVDLGRKNVATKGRSGLEMYRYLAVCSKRMEGVADALWAIHVGAAMGMGGYNLVFLGVDDADDVG